MRYVNAKHEALLQAKLNSLWSQQDYVLSNIELCDKAFYEANKSVTEIEHQVGRYLNMKNITDEIVATGLEGDVVEFGTWQGLGLILLSSCFSGDRTRRKLIALTPSKAFRNLRRFGSKDLFPIPLLRRWKGILSRNWPPTTFCLSN